MDNAFGDQFHLAADALHGGEHVFGGLLARLGDFHRRSRALGNCLSPPVSQLSGLFHLAYGRARLVDGRSGFGGPPVIWGGGGRGGGWGGGDGGGFSSGGGGDFGGGGSSGSW